MNRIKVYRQTKRSIGTRPGDKQVKISAKKYNRKIKTVHESPYPSPA